MWRPMHPQIISLMRSISPGFCMHTQNAVPSEDLLNLYDQVNDYRYEAFIVENYSIIGHLYLVACLLQLAQSILHGPTTAEMFLVRAECR